MDLTYLKCGRLFDGAEERFKENIGIVVEDGKISKIGEGIACPAGAKVVDLTNKTVTPGLIDAHVHFDFIGIHAFDTYGYKTSDAAKVLNLIYCANKSLLGGFTTVRVVGTSINGYGAVDAKNAVNEHKFAASRLVVAPHFLGASGGHCDMSAVLRPDPELSNDMEHRYPTVGSGADFFRDTTRKEIKYGADVVKIIATGGFASPYDDPCDCQLADSELQAIIDTANMLGKPTTGHAYAAPLIKKLVGMGISGIEHGSLIDEEACDMMQEKGAYLVCTFQPYEEAVHMDEEKLARKSPHFIRKLMKYGDQLRKSRQLVVSKILEGKMTIGYGTDMVSVYDNYECWREYSTWQRSGIPALRILRAATSVNAKILGYDDLGVLAPGKTADIVAWSGDFDNDPEVISKCDFVMKDGIVYKQ